MESTWFTDININPTESIPVILMNNIHLCYLRRRRSMILWFPIPVQVKSRLLYVYVNDSYQLMKKELAKIIDQINRA